VIAQGPVSLRKRALVKRPAGQESVDVEAFSLGLGHILLFSSLSQAFSLPFPQLTWRALW
jgi:hypothetical protein